MKQQPKATLVYIYTYMFIVNIGKGIKKNTQHEKKLAKQISKSRISIEDKKSLLFLYPCAYYIWGIHIFIISPS